MRISKKFARTFNRIAEKAQEMNSFSFLVHIKGITYEVCPITNQLYKNGYLLRDNLNLKSMVDLFFAQFNLTELRTAKFEVA